MPRRVRSPQSCPRAPTNRLPRVTPTRPLHRAPPPQAKPSRLNKVAAWVSIVAGSLVILAVLFGSGFYFGRETAPKVPERTAVGTEQNGPMIVPLPRGQFERPGPGIVIPNGPTFQLPNIFPQFPAVPAVPRAYAGAEHADARPAAEVELHSQFIAIS